MDRVRQVAAHLAAPASDPTARCSAAPSVAAPCSAAEHFTPAPIPSGGLFVDDYSKLPQPTTDLAQAKRDIDEFGYCILKDLLSEAECSALADRILEQANAEEALAAADAEAAESLRKMEDMPQWKKEEAAVTMTSRMRSQSTGPERNQQVRSLHNKGDEIISLLENETMLEVVHHVIGNGFQANFLNCEVAKPGSSPRDLHTDQWWMPQPQRADGAPRIKTGSITREGAYDPDWGTQSEEWLTPSLRCNAIWFAGDFHGDNGAT